MHFFLNFGVSVSPTITWGILKHWNCQRTAEKFLNSSVSWGQLEGKKSKNRSMKIRSRNSPFWHSGTCTEIFNERPEWTVNIKEYKIRSIFESLLDSNPFSFNKVYAGNRRCGTVFYDPTKSVYRVSCDGAIAKNLTIRNSGNYLTLCEVEVYRSPSKPCSQEAFETTSTSLSEFKECTVFKGNLVITNQTLSRFDNSRIKAVEFLMNYRGQILRFE